MFTVDAAGLFLYTLNCGNVFPMYHSYSVPSLSPSSEGEYCEQSQKQHYGTNAKQDA